MPRAGDGEANKWYAKLQELYSQESVVEAIQKRPGRRGRVPSQQTLKQYAYQLRWIAQRLDGFETGKTVPSPEDVLDFMEKTKVSDARRKNVYVAMKMWHTGCEECSCCEKYSTHLQRCSEKVAEAYDNQCKTMRQQKNWVNHGDLKKAVAKMRDEVLKYDKNIIWTKEKYIKATLTFILLFHLKYPVRRDLYTVQLRPTAETANFLDEDKKAIVLRKYKTSEKYGEQVFRLSRPMWTIAQRLKIQQRMRDLPQNYLLLNSYWKRHSAHGFTQWFAREMGNHCEVAKGKKLGCTMLRHIVISHVNKSSRKIKERREFAHKIGHSEKTHERYRVH